MLPNNQSWFIIFLVGFSSELRLELLNFSHPFSELSCKIQLSSGVKIALKCIWMGQDNFISVTLIKLCLKCFENNKFQWPWLDAKSAPFACFKKSQADLKYSHLSLSSIRVKLSFQWYWVINWCFPSILNL